MSAITPDEVAKVAHLARIAMSDDKLSEYTQSLSSTLELVQQMQQVDTKGVTPMAHPLDTIQPQRSDHVTEGDFSKAINQMAPKIEANLFLVPQVIE